MNRGTGRKAAAMKGRAAGSADDAGADVKPLRRGALPADTLEETQIEHEQEALEIVTDLTPKDLTARLYRSHPAQQGGEAFVDEFPARLVNHAYVKETYGGGAYRVEIIGLSNKGRDRPARGKLRQETFTVDYSIPPKTPHAVADPVPHAANAFAPKPAPAAPPPPAPVFSPADAINAALQGSVLSMFKSMQELGNLQTSMVERMVAQQAPQRPPVDWGEVAKVAVPAAVTLLTAIMTRKDNSVSQAREMLALMQAANPPQPRGVSPVDAMRDALALADEVRNLAGDGGARAESATPWWADLARVGAELVGNIAAANAAQPVAVAPPPPVQPIAPPAGFESHTLAAGESSTPPAAAPPEPSPLPVNPIVSQLKPFAPHLVQWAQQSRPPEWAAETLLLEIPEGFHEYLATRLEDASVIPELAAAIPSLVPYEPWLQQVRQSIVEQLADAVADTGEHPATTT
jgi:hypothetical protein